MKGVLGIDDDSRFKVDTRDGLIGKIRPLIVDINPICGLQLYQEKGLASGEKVAMFQRAEYDLSQLNWLYRSQATENMTLLGNIFVSQFLGNVKKGYCKYQIDDLLIFYVFQYNDSIAVSIMKPNYPDHLALQMMKDFTNTKSSQEVAALFKAYNGEKLQSDSINSVMEELVETKNILIQDLRKLVVRGEQLDGLPEKTEHLPDEESAMFNQQAKKINQRCCWLM